MVWEQQRDHGPTFPYLILTVVFLESYLYLHLTGEQMEVQKCEEVGSGLHNLK